MNDCSIPKCPACEESARESIVAHPEVRCFDERMRYLGKRAALLAQTRKLLSMWTNDPTMRSRDFLAQVIKTTAAQEECDRAFAELLTKMSENAPEEAS